MDLHRASERGAARLKLLIFLLVVGAIGLLMLVGVAVLDHGLATDCGCGLSQIGQYDLDQPRDPQ